MRILNVRRTTNENLFFNQYIGDHKKPLRRDLLFLEICVGNTIERSWPWPRSPI